MEEEAIRGLLLIDVDGPLYPWNNRPSKRPEGYRSHRLDRRGRWHTDRRSIRRTSGKLIWLHPGHGQMLLDLADQTRLRLTWATAWMYDANRYIGPSIGLPELPVIDFEHTDLTKGGDWKYPAIRRYAGDLPLAWLDDDFNEPEFTEARERFTRARTGSPTMLCHVDPKHGLQQHHIARIEAWADNLPQGEQHAAS